MVLCWLTPYLGLQSSAVTFVFVFLCCLFLPQLTQHSLAVLPVPQRLSLMTRCHQPSRCSLQQVLFSPSTTYPKAPLLHLNDQADGKCGILYSAQSPTCLLLFLPRESHKSTTASFLFALHRNSITDNFTIFPPQLLPDWHHTILLPFTLVFSPFIPPLKIQPCFNTFNSQNIFSP